jgi:hypothetical protein
MGRGKSIAAPVADDALTIVMCGADKEDRLLSDQVIVQLCGRQAMIALVANMDCPGTWPEVPRPSLGTVPMM